MDYELSSTTHVPAVRKYSQLPKLFRWFSQHCVLRSPEESDVMHIWNAVTHPHYARCWTSTVPHSLDEVTQRVHRALSDWNRGTRYALGVHRKSTQEFVGWIELTAHPTQKGAWLMQWFLHPRYALDAIAQEAITATLDLMFSALDAQTLYARSPAGHTVFDTMLNNVGFIEVAPAGALDATTQRPHSHAVYEIRRNDWAAMRGMQGAATHEVAHTAGHAAVSPAWASTTPRKELALV